MASWVALFHADATLRDSGAERPIGVPEIPAHIAGIVRLARVFCSVPLRGRFREPTIFGETHTRATLADRGVDRPRVYAIDLTVDQVVRSWPRSHITSPPEAGEESSGSGTTAANDVSPRDGRSSSKDTVARSASTR